MEKLSFLEKYKKYLIYDNSSMYNKEKELLMQSGQGGWLCFIQACGVFAGDSH